MKILILTSGGDAPGMNKVIALMQKKFKDSLYACEEGFKGLIEGKIALASTFSPLASENEAGSCIRCSRCPEFKTKKGFKKALENAKRFDYVVVLGGNGSYKGCCELNENGVKTIFIPSTIDNDVKVILKFRFPLYFSSRAIWESEAIRKTRTPFRIRCSS